MDEDRTDLAGKRVELIRELVPHLHRRHREGPARRYGAFPQAAGIRSPTCGRRSGIRASETARACRPFEGLSR